MIGGRQSAAYITYSLVAENGAHDTYSTEAVVALIRLTLRYDARPVDATGRIGCFEDENDLLFFLKPAFYHNEVEIMNVDDDDDDDDEEEEEKGEERRRGRVVVSAQTFRDMWCREVAKGHASRPISVNCLSYSKPSVPLFRSHSR